MAAYNPHGAQGCPGGSCDPQPAGKPARDEGYLYWAAWLGHDGEHACSRTRTRTASTAASTSPRAASNVLNILDSIRRWPPLVTPFGAVFETACHAGSTEVST